MEKYVFEFTEDQLRTIDEALQELPYKKAAPIVNDINMQIAKQRAEETGEAE